MKTIGFFPSQVLIDGSVLQLPSMSLHDEGVYRCEAFNASGAMIEQEIEVEVSGK